MSMSWPESQTHADRIWDVCVCIYIQRINPGQPMPLIVYGSGQPCFERAARVHKSMFIWVHIC